MIELNGEKVRLRSLIHSDLDFLYEIENDQRFWAVSNTTKPYTKEILSRYIQSAQQTLAEAQQYRFLIQQTALPTKLGFIDLFDFNPVAKSAGVGIIIHPKYQNQGFANEALRILIGYCRSELTLEILHCTIFKTNRYSIQLFKKNGFTENSVKKDWISNGSSLENQIFLQLDLRHSH